MQRTGRRLQILMEWGENQQTEIESFGMMIIYVCVLDLIGKVFMRRRTYSIMLNLMFFPS